MSQSTLSNSMPVEKTAGGDSQLSWAATQPLQTAMDRTGLCLTSLSDLSVLNRTLRRITERSPKYGSKLATRLARMDHLFFDRAERFLARFEKFLAASHKNLDWGIDCHLKLHDALIQERLEFLRTGRYASSSFVEVERRVYANPGVMEWYMAGLVFSQFLWPEQYARLEFFCEQLPQYADRIGRYLEIGGGHAIYISSAVELLSQGTHFSLVDISPTSMELARGMSPAERIDYHVCDIFEFPRDGLYDFVAAGEILEHLEQPRKLLEGIRGMLAPQGRAFISAPVNAPTLDHIYLFEHPQAIRDLLRSEGFLIESETTRYAEDLPDARAEKLKVAQMFACIVRAE
ncbi:MAG: class I SAM-dependent methyltransferase [Acidobacteriia bacterium]|nr:class I SAM-dependent methyltransferase [Terriglobia bacterium]